ncbi:hypothetical protein F2Q70_00043386 [Brassica cretica]|uniref:Uncharacterized protein n=1 Tax=Brassica cretica TaxID=69181 RepID=A0A8S9KJB3_BRACR|nr:hypothetical protein F2Q70_00043386 [Brassica cretica]
MSLSVDFTSSTTIDCHFIMSIDTEQGKSGGVDRPWILPTFSHELHRRVRCIAMDGDIPTVRLSSSFDKRYIFELAFQCHQFGINQHPVADVIPVLLRSDQSASREEAVEKRNVCRSMHTS